MPVGVAARKRRLARLGPLDRDVLDDGAFEVGVNALVLRTVMLRSVGRSDGSGLDQSGVSPDQPSKVQSSIT